MSPSTTPPSFSLTWTPRIVPLTRPQTVTSCAMMLPSTCAPLLIRRSEARSSPSIRPKTCARPLHSILPTIDMPEPMQEPVPRLGAGGLAATCSAVDCCGCTTLTAASAAGGATFLSFLGALLLNNMSTSKTGPHSGGGSEQVKLHGFAGPSPGPLVGVQTARVSATSVRAQLDFVGANRRPDAVMALHGRALGRGRGNSLIRRTPDTNKNDPLWPDRTRDGQCAFRAGTRQSGCAVQPFGLRRYGETPPKGFKGRGLGSPCVSEADSA